MILPIFLLLLLGGIQVSVWQRADYLLAHAAAEAAIAGAAEPAPPQRCATAEQTAGQVLGHAPESVKCTGIGNLLQVELTDRVRLVAPIVENFPNLLRVEATARAVVR